MQRTIKTCVDVLTLPHTTCFIQKLSPSIPGNSAGSSGNHEYLCLRNRLWNRSQARRSRRMHLEPIRNAPFLPQHPVSETKSQQAYNCSFAVGIEPLLLSTGINATLSNTRKPRSLKKTTLCFSSIGAILVTLKRATFLAHGV